MHLCNKWDQALGQHMLIIRFFKQRLFGTLVGSIGCVNGMHKDKTLFLFLVTTLSPWSVIYMEMSDPVTPGIMHLVYPIQIWLCLHFLVHKHIHWGKWIAWHASKFVNHGQRSKMHIDGDLVNCLLPTGSLTLSSSYFYPSHTWGWVDRLPSNQAQCCQCQ